MNLKNLTLKKIIVAVEFFQRSYCFNMNKIKYLTSFFLCLARRELYHPPRLRQISRPVDSSIVQLTVNS